MEPERCRSCGGSGLHFGVRGGASIHHESPCNSCAGSGIDHVPEGWLHSLVRGEPDGELKKLLERLAAPAPEEPPAGDIADRGYQLRLRKWIRMVHGEAVWQRLYRLEDMNPAAYMAALVRYQRGGTDDPPARSPGAPSAGE